MDTLPDMLDTLMFLEHQPPSPVQIPNGNQVIWQHMKLHFFRTLLNKQKLFLCNAGSYPASIERDLFAAYNFICDFEPDIKQVSKVLVPNTFFSCWYTSVTTNEAIFNEFAGQDGVAISTSIGKLRRFVNVQSDDSGQDILVCCAPVQYISKSDYKLSEDKAFFRNDHNVRVKTIVPFFYKFTNWSYQNEFRVVGRKTPIMNVRSYKTTSKCVGCSIGAGSIIELIDSVAIKASQPKDFVDMLKSICQDFGLILEELERRKQNADGFIQYRIKEG